jgi:hypothetical protein
MIEPSAPAAFRRREILRLAVSAAAGVAVFVRSASAAGYPPVAAYGNPGCGCCGKWAAHLVANGFEVTMQDDPDLGRRRADAGVPADIAGCHTAYMGDIVIEGHVPAEDIIRFLAEKPDARGLAVPGMPVGSPGMETGGAAEKFDVLAFKADGSSRVYARH